ncbi:hypothetical protein [Flavilitoribacter nigricans]|uniref:Uncharacterized protein n=1 Tax=Flavilitoribacter nigricans (strain ATCC 23147 / DSM 23189 / NBRC 102662 / NCIMB 1420 / SS-2) TaxID=1122177 RepID=A0A2D0MXN8_FLAN2|nr:hypothetical protein [Flavilitoribacter nigricans]PHN01042.1 hypothetical protein CRP01_39255 [Flavilitoribacter nigricans DSM 23189 = NBRC 102662]
MKKPSIYLFFSLLFFCACESASIETEVMVLENDFIEAEIDDNMVRFDGYRFGQDESYYTPEELHFTRTTNDGMEDISITVLGVDLKDELVGREVRFGRANDQGEAEGPRVNIRLLSREQGGTSHCPYLTSHYYDLEGTLFIESWSPESSILEGRFEAEKVVPNTFSPDNSSLIGDPGRPIDELFTNRRLLLREGYFRVWLQPR